MTFLVPFLPLILNSYWTRARSGTPVRGGP